MSPTEPIDELHAQCIAARAELRALFVAARAVAAAWEPSPCPSREQWP